MYSVRDRIHNNHRHRINPYHRRRCERLDEKNVGIRRPACLKGTYVEVGLYKGHLAHGNVHRRIRRRVSIWGTCVAENGQVVEVTVIQIRR